MLIQNIGSATSALGFTSNSGPIAVAAPSTQVAPVDSPQTTPVNQAAASTPTDAQLKEAVDSINDAMKQNNSNVEFSIEKGSNKTVIKVVDSQTGQVISQFPSKAVLAISQMVTQSQPGALVQENA